LGFGIIFDYVTETDGYQLMKHSQAQRKRGKLMYEVEPFLLEAIHDDLEQLIRDVI
jgi:hypothetical protein